MEPEKPQIPHVDIKENKNYFKVALVISLILVLIIGSAYYVYWYNKSRKAINEGTNTQEVISGGPAPVKVQTVELKPVGTE